MGGEGRVICSACLRWENPCKKNKGRQENAQQGKQARAEPTKLQNAWKRREERRRDLERERLWGGRRRNVCSGLPPLPCFLFCEEASSSFSSSSSPILQSPSKNVFQMSLATTTVISLTIIITGHSSLPCCLLRIIHFGLPD